MNKKNIFLFSGQGSQYFQMAKELYSNNSFFKNWIQKLDNIVQKTINSSIADVVYDPGKKISDVFNRTIYTSPAIFIIQYALAQTLIQMGIRPDYLIGTSLGEFVAAAISGVIDYSDALDMIIKQTLLIEKKCLKGGMLAIFAKPSLFKKEPDIYNYSEVAGINYDEHFLVAIEEQKITTVVNRLQELKIDYQEIPVTYAFHSTSIDIIAHDVKNALLKYQFQKPQMPVISCVTTNEIKEYYSDYFWDIVRKPIKFMHTIQNFEQNGDDHIYIDLGASGTLANFTKKLISNQSSSQIFSLVTMFGEETKKIQELEKYLISINKINKKAQLKGKQPMITYVFPGQGSQKKGMGEGLFDKFKEYTQKSDAILGYSIKDLCLYDKENQLNQTNYTQPALFVVNALHYLKKIDETGKYPDFVAGHSLGEYSALFASGAVDFETALKLVQKRGELMAQIQNGGMAAVIGLDGKEVESVLEKNHLNDIDIANLNSPKQIVISGPVQSITQAQKVFEEAGAALYVKLKISGAFHSRYMQEAKKEFMDILKSVQFTPINIPLISNVSARPYLQNQIADNLANQLIESVKWCESVRYLMGKGEMSFEEVGPGNVLTNLIKKIQSEAEPLIVEEVQSVNQVDYTDTEIKEINSNEKIAIEKEKENIFKKVFSGIKKNSQQKNELFAYDLGNAEFKKDYNVKYAYTAGSMYRGISSAEMVIKLAKAGLLGFYGCGGVALEKVEKDIFYIKKNLENNESFGMNLLYNPARPDIESQTVELFLKHGISITETSAYIVMKPTIVHYRLKGLIKNSKNQVVIKNRVIAKVSRPEIASNFLKPAPQEIVDQLLKEGKITAEEAECAPFIPMADDICAEADSGGHTDMSVSFALLPMMMRLRDEMMEKFQYEKRIRVGTAGGIGTPEAAAAAFIMGADFITTGSINQCTVESGISDSAKNILENINIQDTEYAPAGDMFEMGSKVQVVKKGIFFPARANKLYQLYLNYNSLDEIDQTTKKQIQDNYFKKSFNDVFEEVKKYYLPEEVARAENESKYKMALIFRWYFEYSTALALKGNEDEKVNYQIQCGPSLGAFNQWVKKTELKKWQNRKVDEIGLLLLNETANVLSQRISQLISSKSIMK